MEAGASNPGNLAVSDSFEVFGSDAEEFDSEESRDSFASMQSSIARSSDTGEEALSERAVAHSFAGATDGSSFSGRSLSSTSSSHHDEGSNPPENVGWPPLSPVYIPVLQEVHTLVNSNVPTSSPNHETHENSSDEDNEEQRRVWRRLGQEQKMKRKLEVSTDGGSAKRSCDEPSGSAEAKDAAEPRVAMCSVCLEEIDEGGDHRLVALKCGHPFGESCVKKWLDTMKQSCPLCNRRAKLKDIRVVFLDCCRVGTSFELAEARKEASELRTSSAQQQAKMHDYELQLGALKTENFCLRLRLRTLESSLHRGLMAGAGSAAACAADVSKSTFPSSYSFTRLSGQSKYMAYAENMNLIAVSMRPTQGLFDGGGVELCSLYDLKSRRVKILHRREIKDLSFHSYRHWLLTASLDNTARISDVTNMSMSNVQNIQLDRKVWSCCWSQSKATNFYLGLANGIINEYDVRMVSEPVNVLRGQPRRVPIASMRSFEIESFGSRVSGILCTQMRHAVRLYKAAPLEEGGHSAQDIPVSGFCFSLFYDKESSSVLVSTREPRNQTVMNELWKLDVQNDDISTNLRSNFRSGGCAAMISRPIICQSQSDESWACCLDDYGKSVQVFSCADGVLRHNLATQDPEQAQMTQVECVKLPGRCRFALLGLSVNGLSTYS